MILRRQFAVGALFLGGLLLAACPTTKTEEPNENNGSHIGMACSLDTECGGAICLGGVCVASDTDAGGQVMTSSSSGGSSGASGHASSSGGMHDAGAPDLYVPHGIITTNPFTGPIEFGAQRIGQSVEKTILVSNTGDAPVTIVSLGFRNNTSGEFTLTVVGTQPTSLMPNDQFTVRVTHTPSDASPDHAFLSLVTTASNPLVELELVAEFKGDATMVVHKDVTFVGPSITAVQMNPVALNAMGTQHIYVKNVGAADSALTVTSVAMVPATSSVFTVTAGPMPRSISSFSGTCVDIGGCGPGSVNCTGGLCLGSPDAGALPLDVIDVTITFSATQAGMQSTQVVINATAGTQTLTHTVDVTALGQIGRLEVDPDPIDFGDVFIGHPKTIPVTITNAGNALAELASIGFQFSSQTAYAVDTTGLTFPYQLPPTATVQVNVTFNPGNLGNFPNFLEIAQTSGMPTHVEISGLGANAPHIEVPAEINFGPSYVGSPHMLPLTIRNTAAGLLRINRAYVEGSGNTPFTFGPNTFPDPVQFMGTQDIQVTYIPPALGPEDSYYLAIETNDPVTPSARVHLRGTPVRPVANIVPTPASLNFGSTIVGVPAASQPVTIRNFGAGDLVVNSDLIIRDTNNALQTEFTVTSNKTLPYAVQPGGGDNVIFTVNFTASSGTVFSASFHVTTTDPMAQNVDVQLTGGGAACPPRAHATVSTNGMNCVYTCDSGFHECGATCLDNNSPDSCGNRCSPCETRAGASRGCTASTNSCTYACINPNHDLNGDLNAAQGASNGCEYLCGVTNPSAEVCDGVDNNCNGSTDENQPLESPEPPSACGGAAINLGDVNDSEPQQAPNQLTFTGYKMGTTGDSDWFTFRAHENTSCGVTGCWGGPWPDDQTYEVTVSLEGVPAGVDYDLWVDEGGCGGGRCSSAAGAGANEKVVRRWKGECGSSDNKQFYVRVFTYPDGTGAGSCYSYTLKVSNWKESCGSWHNVACHN